jgi:hypothetical protein
MNRKYKVVLTGSRRDPQKDHVKYERTVLWACREHIVPCDP